MSKITRAILIDPAAYSLSEVEIGDHTTIAPLLGCKWFTHTGRLGDVGLYLDDEGLLKPIEDIHWFMIDGHIFAGRGLIIGLHPEGNSVDCPITVEEAEQRVKFGRPSDPVAYWRSQFGLPPFP